MYKIKAIAFMLVSLFSTSVIADPFVYGITTFTAANGNTGIFSGSNSVPVTFYVTLDNGGNSRLNQTWAVSDIQEVSFVLSGVRVSTINTQAPSYTLNATGTTTTFQSDASGNMTLVPNGITGSNSSAGAVTVGSDPSLLVDWDLLGPVFYSSNLGANQFLLLNPPLLASAPSNWIFYSSGAPSGGGSSGGLPSAGVSSHSVPSLPIYGAVFLALLMFTFGSRRAKLNS